VKYLILISMVTALAVCLAWTPAAESATSRDFGAASSAGSQDLRSAIAQAMKQNPDLRLAEAKLSEALAERDRVRLQVTRDLVRCYESMALAKSSLALEFDGLRRIEMLIKNGTQPTGSADPIRLLIAEKESQLRELMAERDYLMGKGSGEEAESAGSRAARGPGYFVGRRRVILERPELSEAQRALLGTKVRIEAPDQSIEDFMTLVSQALGDRGFTTVFDNDWIDESEMIEWRMKKDVSVQALFEWLSDRSSSPLAFVFRDYGVYVTSASAARSIDAPCFPAVPLVAD
jgi:hypothetical protein